jgi:XTP/dITP diphosphohydrolase
MNPKVNEIEFQDGVKKLNAFERLLQTMEVLRALCPWDQKQDWRSLRPLTIEETYELAEAILDGDSEGVKEELGDILLHIVFYAKIAEEEEQFSIVEVIHTLCDKLEQRHPHIYGDIEVADEEEVKRNWERLKMKEGKKSVLSGVPSGLPSIVKAYRMQQKTAQVGFEWTEKEEAWNKIEEEVQEFRSARNQNEREEEFGDLLFSLINYARYENIDPDEALSKTNAKFKTRFEYIEAHANGPLEDMSLMEMDELWERAKENL